MSNLNIWNTISWNLKKEIKNFSNDIQILDRFLDKCFARNTFLGNDEIESNRLDIYIDKLINIYISNLRDIQKNTIRKIGSMMMRISSDEFDEYFQKHTWWESYDSINKWHKSKENKYFILWILILKNSKLMSWENYSFGKAPSSKNASLLNNKISDDFNALYIKNSKNMSMWVQSLNYSFVNIFSKYGNSWLQNFYKILFLANHDASFHNIDTFEEENKNNKQIVEIVKIDDYKNIAYNNENYKKREEYESYQSTINNLWEQEYVSLKEHQTHFVNSYQKNPEFKTYIVN